MWLPFLLEHGSEVSTLALSCPRFGAQGLGKVPATFILVNNVTFEMNSAGRAFNRCQPRRIVFFGVLEELHAVARNKVRYISTIMLAYGQIPFLVGEEGAPYNSTLRRRLIPRTRQL